MWPVGQTQDSIVLEHWMQLIPQESKAWYDMDRDNIQFEVQVQFEQWF